jgi:hypothetical protein
LPIRFYFKKAKQKLANSKRGAGQARQFAFHRQADPATISFAGSFIFVFNGSALRYEVSRDRGGSCREVVPSLEH